MIGLVTFFSRKESNQRNAPPSASRCFSVNQGTARRASRLAVGSTGWSRLFAPDSPAVLGALQGGLNSRERTHDRSCRPEPSVGSALHRPRTQETVERLRVGPGRTVRGMDAAAELTGMYLQRVLPGPTRRLPPIPGRRRSTQPTTTQQKTRPKPGFSHDHTTIGNQSPCCFCRCSQRSWASMVRSAVRRASRRSRPISSPVSTQ